MKTKLIAVAAALLAVQAGAEEASPLKTDQEMASYGIGMYMAKTFRKDGVEVDQALVMRGLRDGMAGTTVVPDKTLRRVMGDFQAEVRRRVQANRQIAAADNQKTGAAFMAANGAKDGVVTLASGLEYKILKAGDGPKPTEDNTVDCLYRGTLLNGTEFDATEPGKPASLKVGQLIPGWKEALKLMPAGSKWEIVVPPQMAYGLRGAGSEIGPNETLVFEVELLAVK